VDGSIHKVGLTHLLSFVSANVFSQFCSRIFSFLLRLDLWKNHRVFELWLGLGIVVGVRITLWITTYTMLVQFLVVIWVDLVLISFQKTPTKPQPSQEI
jgi:hypothetical protein